VAVVRRRARNVSLLFVVWVVIGLVVALQRSYITVSLLKGLLSAILAAAARVPARPLQLGVGLAQIGEFSFVVLGLGVAANVVTQGQFSAVLAAAALSIAAGALGALRARLWDDAVGTYHFDAGDGPRLPTLLSDLAALLGAELDLYEAGGGSTALAFAHEVATRLVTLEDAEHGGFTDAPPRDEPGRVARADRPIEDNALAADALLRLATISGEERWRELAIRALRSFAGVYRESGQFAAPYARAVSRALADPLRIGVTGSTDDPAATALWREAVACDDPARVVERLDPRRDRDRMDELGYPATETAAYVCVGTSCSAPIGGAAALRDELARARARFTAVA
jgi:uncharacterized protein YyaL (SSP411 family)